jgi:hypothetical protein
MTFKKRVQFAVLFGVLAEFVVVVPLLIVGPHLGLGPLPVWVEILKKLQTPSAPLVLRLLHADTIQQLSAHLRIARGVFAGAEVLSMVAQAALFAGVTLALLYVLPPKKAGPTLAARME